MSSKKEQIRELKKTCKWIIKTFSSQKDKKLRKTMWQFLESELMQIKMVLKEPENIDIETPVGEPVAEEPKKVQPSAALVDNLKNSNDNNKT